jgi:aminopeptidase N
VRNHAAGEISWDEFLDEIEKGSGMNLRWFYDQWFERKGAPRWEVSWQQEGDTIRGTIMQQQPYFRADVEVLIKGDHGREFLRTVELRSEKTEFSFPADFKVRTLIVDPHFLVLHHK